jgi:hypothetical protein
MWLNFKSFPSVLNTGCNSTTARSLLLRPTFGLPLTNINQDGIFFTITFDDCAFDFAGVTLHHWIFFTPMTFWHPIEQVATPGTDPKFVCERFYFMHGHIDLSILC